MDKGGGGGVIMNLMLNACRNPLLIPQMQAQVSLEIDEDSHCA